MSFDPNNEWGHGPEDLVIHRILDPEVNPLLVDFSIIGLDAYEWQYDRGARAQRLYKNGDDVAVRDTYSYSYDASNRFVTSYVRTIEWLAEDGSVSISKNVTPSLTGKKIKELNRAIRQGRIDYLESAAEALLALSETVPEPLKSQFAQISQSIDLLFEHYSTQVVAYIHRGEDDFEDAVENELEASMVSILALPARPPDSVFTNGLNVKQSIIYQLTGVIP